MSQTLSENSGEITEGMKKTYANLRENISTARDIVRGKTTPKTQEEAIIAERVVAQYENKVKEMAIVIYDPSVPFLPSAKSDPIVKIETVKYDDDSFSASAEVNIEGNSTTIPFSETYKSKKEAIK
jgi:hypothetical protein